jgi:serine/threonine protein kinase
MRILNPAWENWFRFLLSWLCDGYWPDCHEETAAAIRGRQRAYTLQRLHAVGDVADVFLAVADSDGQYLLKESRVPKGFALLNNERQTLARLLAAAGHTTYRKYLPWLVESFVETGKFPKRINVFSFQPGFHTLEHVHEQHPSLDGRHLGWIFNRLLTVLGFCHSQAVVHGAVLPCHVMIDAESHGLQLVGWGQSVAYGRPMETVPTRYADWYPPEVQKNQPAGPATDLFLAARCLVYLAGGDPVTNALPEAVPLPMQRFLATCLLESPRMRPDDAWALLEDFEALLRSLYGPPKFHPLHLKPLAPEAGARGWSQPLSPEAGARGEKENSYLRRFPWATPVGPTITTTTGRNFGPARARTRLSTTTPSGAARSAAPFTRK